MAGKPSRGVTVDDFKLIKGIGSAIEKRLRRAGIRTFAQLAALSPTDVAALGVGQSARRIRRQGWNTQARKLARKTRARRDDDAPANIGRQRYATFTVELLLEAEGQAHRTRVVHVQDGDEGLWAGWEAARLVGFLSEHAGLRPTPGPPAPAKVVPEPNEHPARLTVGDELPKNSFEGRAEAGPVTEPAERRVEASRVNEASPVGLRLEVGDFQLDEVRGGRRVNGDGPAPTKRLGAQITFRLYGSAAEPAHDEWLRCLIQILACELETGRAVVLAADQQALHSRVAASNSKLEFELPGVGRYQLLGIVLLSEVSAIGVALGPVLRVIP